MINLIPPTAKKKIFLEYWARVATVWLSTASSLMIIGIFLLLPSYVLIDSKIDVYAEGIDELRAEANEYDSSVAQLIKASDQAKLILGQQEYTDFSTVLTLLEGIASELVTLTSYEFTRTNTHSLSPIVINGRASTREALADFREALLLNPAIETAFLPLSNLARDRDITFSITITFAQPKSP
jgi:hypothetical protein